MRILLICLSLISFSVLGDENKDMKDLFAKYDQVMDFKKFELIDEIFTKKFIKESGGKTELIEKIKGLPTPKDKSKPTSKTSWRKGLKGDMYFVKYQEVTKNKKADNHPAEFIILKEDGKLKIDGTLSDGD